jgi:hypothetical protein
MRAKRSTYFLGAALCALAGFAVQAVGVARYVSRSPDDWVGIGLYSATLVAFGIAALGFFVRWRQGRRAETEPPQPPD